MVSNALEVKKKTPKVVLFLSKADDMLQIKSDRVKRLLVRWSVSDYKLIQHKISDLARLLGLFQLGLKALYTPLSSKVLIDKHIIRLHCPRLLQYRIFCFAFSKRQITMRDV